MRRSFDIHGTKISLFEALFSLVSPGETICGNPNQYYVTPFGLNIYDATNMNLKTLGAKNDWISSIVLLTSI